MTTRIMSIAMFVCGLASGQATTPAAVAPAVTEYPSYMVAMGGGYTRNNGLPNITEGWVSAFVGLGAGMYSKTTIDMTSINTIRTGFCKVFSQSGNFMLGSCVDAGVQNVTPVIGSFSGGAFVGYDLKGLSRRLAGIKLLGELRITGATGVASTSTTVTTVTGQTTTTTMAANGATNQVTPGFYFGIGKTF